MPRPLPHPRRAPSSPHRQGIRRLLQSLAASLGYQSANPLPTGATVQDGPNRVPPCPRRPASRLPPQGCLTAVISESIRSGETPYKRMARCALSNAREFSRFLDQASSPEQRRYAHAQCLPRRYPDDLSSWYQSPSYSSDNSERMYLLSSTAHRPIRSRCFTEAEAGRAHEIC